LEDPPGWIPLEDLKILSRPQDAVERQLQRFAVHPSLPGARNTEKPELHGIYPDEMGFKRDF